MRRLEDSATASSILAVFFGLLDDCDLRVKAVYLDREFYDSKYLTLLYAHNHAYVMPIIRWRQTIKQKLADGWSRVIQPDLFLPRQVFIDGRCPVILDMKKENMGKSRGLEICAIAIVLFMSTMALSATFAPSIGTNKSGQNIGKTLIGIHGGGPGLHESGSVHLLEGKEIQWKSDTAGSYFGVEKLENGSIVAAFLDKGRKNCGPYKPPCARTGFHIINLKSKKKVVSSWSFPVRTAMNSEVHDVEPLPSGGYILTDMEYERILILENGSVKWQWNASNFYSSPEDPTKTDWLHINDVDRLKEGRYLVSVRNANQLLVIERGRGVIEVINKDEKPDDGMRRGDPSIINHQHNPQWLGNRTILVADSENNRIVELQRTEKGNWEPVWSLEQAEGVELAWPRDADRLPNGNTIITDSSNRRIFEINESGAVVWSVQTEAIPYEADRLPYGEQVRVQNEITNKNRTLADVKELNENNIPVLTPLLGIARTSYPLPYWFNELQLAIVLLSISLFLFGGSWHTYQSFS